MLEIISKFVADNLGGFFTGVLGIWIACSVLVPFGFMIYLCFIHPHWLKRKKNNLMIQTQKIHYINGNIYQIIVLIYHIIRINLNIE